ncbi:hypothetical protein GCM10023189_27670 [Nibrella saemangeumensis]|uniref:Uncharacterized protein n=1 Tax=Nibrella saemangeumensis TaxID=1084526 RepID=A0ABP8MWC5_9BACT
MKKVKVIYKTSSQLLVGCLLSLSSFGQLHEIEASKTNWTTVGEIKWLANTKASLKYFVSKTDTTYHLYLQDDQKLKNSSDMTVYKHFSIFFSGIDNTIGNLYDLLNTFFTAENRKNKELEKIFKLGNEMVHVQHYPKLTAPAIMVSTKENHIVLTQKEIKKLFNR